jgi:26S proteasome regulatory subunit N13
MNYNRLFFSNLSIVIYLQAANQFSSALSSGQMGQVMSQFGLPAEVASAANTGDMQAFFKALENTATPPDDSKNKENEEKKKDDKPKDEGNDKKDGDAGMSLD